MAFKNYSRYKTQAELHDVFDFMLNEAEIDFRVDLEKIKDTLHELSFDDQKKTLIKIIDKTNFTTTIQKLMMKMFVI